MMPWIYVKACTGDWTPCLVHHSCIGPLVRVPALLAVNTCSACSAPPRLQVSQTMHSWILIMIISLVVALCAVCKSSHQNCSRAYLSLPMTLELSISSSSSPRGEVDNRVPALTLLVSSLVLASTPTGTSGASSVLGHSLARCGRTRSLPTTSSAPLSVAMCSCTGACRYW